jgi:hypothetical protein
MSSEILAVSIHPSRLGLTLDQYSGPAFKAASW